MCGVILVLYGLMIMISSTVINLQFYSKQGYYKVLLGGFLLTLFYEERDNIKILFYFGILTDIAASLVIHYETCGLYALPAIIATVLILVNPKIKRSKNILYYLTVIILIIFIAFEAFAGDVIMISNTEHGGETVFNQTLEKIENGPAKGSYARKVDVQKYNEIYDWITKNLKKSSKVCYFGRNVLLYLMSDSIEPCVPQLFMDYSSDDVLVEYYAKYPDEIPDIVILDVSPISKRLISEKEKVIVDDYYLIYESSNYQIYDRELNE